MYSYCFSSQSDSPEAKQDDIRDGVQLEIEDLCQCGFTIQHLSDSEFLCFIDLSEVTFRARLHGTAQATSSELIGYLEQWIAGGGSILVERVRHFTDSTSCQPVEISSFSDPECGPTESPTESPTSDDTESRTQAAQSDNTTAIIGGVVAVVLIVAIIVAITIIVIVTLVLKNRRASITLHKEG